MKRAAFPILIVLTCAAAQAVTIDMNNPRRAVGMEDEIRVDAQLTTEFVTPSSPLGLTYQIHNLSQRPVAVATGECEASYDTDTGTITLSVGSEVPKNGEMPAVALVSVGETRTFTASAIVRMMMTRMRPRFVEIKVNVLRDLSSLADLIERRRHSTGRIRMSDAQFDQWIGANQSIVLNTIPVSYRPAEVSRAGDASQR